MSNLQCNAVAKPGYKNKITAAHFLTHSHKIRPRIFSRRPVEKSWLNSHVLLVEQQVKRENREYRTDAALHQPGKKKKKKKGEVDGGARWVTSAVGTQRQSGLQRKTRLSVAIRWTGIGGLSKTKLQPRNQRLMPRTQKKEPWKSTDIDKRENTGYPDRRPPDISRRRMQQTPVQTPWGAIRVNGEVLRNTVHHVRCLLKPAR